MEILAKHVGGDQLNLNTCHLCTEKAITALATVDNVQGIYVLKCYALCELHIELVTKVLSGEIKAMERINYEKATKGMINLRG
jgi:hypothetical protein